MVILKLNGNFRGAASIDILNDLQIELNYWVDFIIVTFIVYLTNIYVVLVRLEVF